MTACTGYIEEAVKPFFYSLAKHYSGDVVVFADKHLETFDRVRATIADMPAAPLGDVCSNRHEMCLKWLKPRADDYDQVFLTDSRDVIFQADPFSMFADADLEVFAENGKIGYTDTNNPVWILRAYDKATLDSVSSFNVLCAGTTRGSTAGILKYLECQVQARDEILARGLSEAYGDDQAAHNVLYRSGAFADLKCSETMSGYGAVRTLSRDVISEIQWDSEGNMLNVDGSVTPVVHLYDSHKFAGDMLSRLGLWFVPSKANAKMNERDFAKLAQKRERRVERRAKKQARFGVWGARKV